MIPRDGRTGTHIFKQSWIGTDQYIVGLGTDPKDWTSICATAIIPEVGKKVPEPFTPCLYDLNITSDALSFKYKTPSGNKPETFKNWVGLWQGDAPSFDGTDCLKWEWVPGNQWDGTGFLNYTFLRGATYTIAYATGNKWQDICMYKTFTIE
jgi:hypothetical protein